MGAVGPAAGEMGEHLGGGDEEDLVAAAAGLVGEGLAEVTLADPGRAVDQDVLVPLDELAGGEIEDLGLVELRVEAEVEALEGLGGVEGGPAQAEPELALGAALHLVLQEHGEELDEGGRLLDRLAVAHLEGLQDAGEPERAEHGGELMGQFHGDLPLPHRGRGRRWSRGGRAAGGPPGRRRDGREARAAAGGRGRRPGSSSRCGSGTRRRRGPGRRRPPGARRRSAGASRRTPWALRRRSSGRSPRSAAMKAAQVGPISAARVWHHAGVCRRKWTLSGGRWAVSVRRWPGRARRCVATRRVVVKQLDLGSVARTQSRWPIRRWGPE